MSFADFFREKEKKDQGRRVGKARDPIEFMSRRPTHQKELADVWSEIEPVWCGSYSCYPGSPKSSFGDNRRTSPPVAAMRRAAAPQFRPLTEADVQDALAQVKAAAAALDQRFATPATSADGWKEYLSWDQFKGELQKAKPDDAVLKMSTTSWPPAMKGWN